MNIYYHQGNGSHYKGRVFIKRCWVLLAASFFFGMSYLWLYSHIVDTSNVIELYEHRMSHLRDRSILLESKLEYLQTPSVITGNLEELKIVLVDPYPEQLVRVYGEEPITSRKEIRSRPPQDIILSIVR